MWIGDSDIVTTLTARRFGVPPERMATWPLFAANPEAPQAKPWQPGQTLRLGSLGRLHPQKSYNILINALALLKQRGFVAPVPFEITIAGEGSDREALARAAHRAGCSELRLAGFAERPLDFLAGLHLYLQPSNLEGFCIAVHEAMQASLPVIASAVGQIPYTLEDGLSGWLVPPLDAEALADALAEALSNPAQVAAMGQVARARVLPLYSKEAFRQAGESILYRLHERGVFDPDESAIPDRS
jgi:glycosyltransferase involved in cell wall biosynthesis